MIRGVGVDLCLVSRVERAIESDYFVRRIFSPEEIDYARGQGRPARHFASAFAAKEALAKATGMGLFGVGLAESHVERTEQGPVLVWSENLRAKLQARGIEKCWLSLSHEGDYALAFVVLES